MDDSDIPDWPDMTPEEAQLTAHAMIGDPNNQIQDGSKPPSDATNDGLGTIDPSVPYQPAPWQNFGATQIRPDLAVTAPSATSMFPSEPLPEGGAPLPPSNAAMPDASASGQGGVLSNPLGFNIDYGKISANEKPRLDAYLVNQGKTDIPRPKSGVTVATGFDLGQHELTDLNKAGVLDNTMQLLSPYLGLQGYAAKNALDLAQDLNGGSPIVIPQDDADKLDAYAKNGIAGALEQRYDSGVAANFLGNSKSTYNSNFQDLPKNTQTAIYDFAYQKGPNSTSPFWSYVTSGDWQGAINYLRTSNDKDQWRRSLEAGWIAADHPGM